MNRLFRWRAIGCLFVVALNLCSLEIARGAPPRIAVIGDETTATAADFAVEALSKSGVLELVERQRLDAVLKEQKLAVSGMTAADALRLGQLVKADGVLLLVGRAVKDKQTMAARLVAVNPGVILWSLHQPLPLDKIDDWQTTIRARVEAALPKLSVLAADAIPLSVVSVTSGVKRRDFLRIEGELRQLLIHRLTHEPSLFVLERQQLELLDREKSQPGPASPLAEQPFWTGRHLLEAEFNQDLNDETKLVVTLSLSRAGQKEPQRLVATGRSDQLAALAEDLVKQVVRALDREPSGAAWPAQAEAQRFFQAAYWIREQSDWNSPAIWEAVDAAWALGLRTDDVYSWRAQGLRQKTWGSDKRDVAQTVERLEEAARFSLERPLAKDTFYRSQQNDPVGMYSSNDSANGIRSLTLNKKPLPDELAEVRRLTRELFERVAESPAWKTGLSGEERLELAWTWTERPSDTIAVYRQLLAPEAQPHTPILRYRWRQRFRATLANWHGESPEEVSRVQQEFVAELMRSTNPENKLTGYHAALRLAAKGEAQAKAQQAIEEAIWSLRDEFARGLYSDYLMWAVVSPPSVENREFCRKLFAEFGERKNCDLPVLYTAFLSCDRARQTYTPQQTRSFHAALRRVVGRNITGYEGTAFRRTLRELEENHPELAATADVPPTPGSLVVPRVSWPKLSDAAAEAPQSTFAPEHVTATWHGDRLWIIATLDDKIGVLSVNPATKAADFFPLPKQARYRQPNLMQLDVADDAILVGLDHRDAPRRDGLFRYDRRAERWHVVENAYGLNGGKRSTSLARVGRCVYSLFIDSPFDDQRGARSSAPNEGVLEIDLDTGHASLLVSTHRKQGGGPFDDPSRWVFMLLPGPEDSLYVMSGIRVPSARPHSWDARAYSPKDGLWREIRPSQWMEAERRQQRRQVGGYPGVVHWLPGDGGPQYWAADPTQGYGDQPTQAILYGNQTTGSIVSVPVRPTLNADFGRRHLPEAAQLNDAAIARRVRETSEAWLFTPGGVVFWRPKQPFWWFVDAEEVRQAAHARSAARPAPPRFQQPLVLSEHKPGRKTQLQAATGDGKTAPWLKSLWNDRQPVMSPNGQRVAFVSDRFDNDDIFLINADGSGLTNVTDSWADDSEPKFRSDGKQLTFRSAYRGKTETRTIDLP